jgi:hypothetical protein
MEVHKPKHPVEGLRELLKEVGIIVLGVLIALGAEQAVQWLHERHDRAEARENIRAELAADLADLRNRNAIEPCIQRRMDELATRIGASQGRGYLPPSWVGRPQIYQMVSARWTAATSAGRATLLSADDQATFGQLYARLDNLTAIEVREQQAWAHLRVMEGLARVSPVMEAQLRTALADARLADWEMRLQLLDNEDFARQLKLPRVAARDRGSPSICLPIDLPRAEALRRIAAIFGAETAEP